MNPADAFTLAAQVVFPVESPPIAPGRVSVREGRIEAVEPGAPQRGDLDLGSAAILPGFVNAHTHLELPFIEPPAADPEDQIAWLERVVVTRRHTTPDAAARQVERGIAASLAAGTTLVGDISTAGLSWTALNASPLRGVVFSELIGLKRERAMSTSTMAFEWLAKVSRNPPDPARLRPGLSPHAPYTTAGWLYERATSAKVPLATHLAELPEELTLLKDRAGPLRQFLERIDAWDDAWTPLSHFPADYLRKGALKSSDWLVAHATYLGDDNFWQLRPQAAPASQRVAVAYCPRTTARFGHEPHPVVRMLERGIAVCLGTDSLASSPTLSILDELRFLNRTKPELGGDVLLAMATLAGAWALRFDDQCGSLRPGKAADIAVVALPDARATDPHQRLLDADARVLRTYIHGTLVYQDEPGPSA